MLPPGYQDHPDLDLYAYIYRYDYLDRLVYKKLPGCAPSYLVYDAAHRLVFSQDGCQRNDSLWSFFVYDVYGRVVVEGECSNSDKHVRTAGETVVLGTLMEGDTGLAYSGYQSSFDLVDPCVYVVNYYDTYDFRTRNGFSAYNFPEGTVSATGNLTGSILCTHGSSGFIYSADYYDINKRIVKSLSSRVNGGMDTYATEYSFQGRPLSVLHTHTDSSGYSLTERYTYTYDHSSRLTRVSHQYDNNPSVLLVEHTYDELGRLQTDKLDNGIYATDYAYNIRNWLTGIEGGKFSQSLHYTDGLGVPCYNGNISSMTWKSGAGATPRGYKFSYDRLGRLTDAEYGEGPSLSVNTNRFNEQVTGYDKMGNILGLKRYGQTSATGYDVIDDLSLSYAGNRLKKVADRSGTSAFNNGFEFKDGIDLPTEYEYDENGNLTKDLNKNITAIQYNCLNLPSRVMFANGNSISYLYDAAGRKLRTVHVLEGDSVTTDYCGNVVYENGVPQILLTEVGYVSLTDGKYHYYLKDHQGNNRVVVDEEGTVEEVNHYYPFGGVFSSTGDAQPYKYNGKELDRKGGLDWYDYGARYYDAALGRWHVVDPMSEKYYGVSPYLYCVNNPILLVDPNGMWPTWRGIRNGLNNALNTTLSFANGAVRAVTDNILLGSTSLRETGIYSSAGAYNVGQDVGDVISLFIGGAEVIRGSGEVAAGLLGSPETGGVSLTVSTKGVVDVTHGSLMATSGAMKLFSRKGRVNENSSSDRDAAQKTSEYKKAKSGSGKEKANDVPDWVKGEKPYKNENGKDFAKRLLEKRFGKDAKYKTGPGSDYNKIKKYGDRNFE